MDSSLRIIVTGLIAQHPLIGGITWHYLQYLIGLADLGHDVFYFEDSGESPYNLDGGTSGDDWAAIDCRPNVNYLAQTMEHFGFGDRWAYHCAPIAEWFGLSDMRRKTIIESADLLINVSGSLENPEGYRQIPHLIYIDTDPIFTQIKILSGMPKFAERVQAHDTHFSYGESLTADGPTATYDWLPTRQPIILSHWELSAPFRDVITTVMNWTSYAPLAYSGVTYGQKDVEFRRFLRLPERVAPVTLEVALSKTQHHEWLSQPENLSDESGAGDDERTPTTPQELLRNYGWRVVDAIELCGDYDSYRRYIISSKAEWSVAKNGYVLGGPGWFSERSACYLAAGRPVIVQDTGFAGALPVGDGIMSFKSLQEAVMAIQELEADYAHHARAARAIAETFFEAGDVLSRLIDDAMIHYKRSMQAEQHQALGYDEVTVAASPKAKESGEAGREE